MTSPSGRVPPDAADLRLLAELANNGEIGLPQAAWQAGMSQAEAAERLVAMASAGFPLRLVAQGDPGLLWQIISRGPRPDQPPLHFPQPSWGQPSGPQGPMSGRQPLVPVPLEEEPFRIGRPIDAPESTWGIPGSSAWANSRGSNAEPPSAETTQAVPAPSIRETESAAIAASILGGEAMRSGGSVMSGNPRVGASQPAVGLSGEQLLVTLDELVDPGNSLLTNAGYRLDPAERAVLVRSTVRNDGPAPHAAVPDVYLFLVDQSGRTLPKAPVSLADRPAHRIGIEPGHTSTGWTVFLIEAQVRLSGVRWCVRPDLADRTLTWSC